MNIPAEWTAPHIVHHPSPEVGMRARKILSLLAPKLPAGERLVRRGRNMDGGYVMLDTPPSTSPVYSFGIGYDVAWDSEMAERGHVIFQYDHTVEAPPAAHANFRFSKQKVEPEFIEKILGENGHASRNDLILQMDIEGDEWAVLPSTAASTLACFDQIIIELHEFMKLDDEALWRKMLLSFERLAETHQIIHVHANNWGWLGFLGGVLIPGTFEVTLARKAGREFTATDREYPTPLDYPCNPAAADYYLGKIGLQASG